MERSSIYPRHGQLAHPRGAIEQHGRDRLFVDMRVLNARTTSLSSYDHVRTALGYGRDAMPRDVGASRTLGSGSAVMRIITSAPKPTSQVRPKPAGMGSPNSRASADHQTFPHHSTSTSSV